MSDIKQAQQMVEWWKFLSPEVGGLVSTLSLSNKHKLLSNQHRCNLTLCDSAQVATTGSASNLLTVNEINTSI